MENRIKLTRLKCFLLTRSSWLWPLTISSAWLRLTLLSVNVSLFGVGFCASCFPLRPTMYSIPGRSKLMWFSAILRDQYMHEHKKPKDRLDRVFIATMYTSVSTIKSAKEPHSKRKRDLQYWAGLNNSSLFRRNIHSTPEWTRKPKDSARRCLKKLVAKYTRKQKRSDKR